MAIKTKLTEPNHDCNAHSGGFCFDCDECDDPIELDSAWWINDRRICEECLERNLKANPRIKFIYG